MKEFIIFAYSDVPWWKWPANTFVIFCVLLAVGMIWLFKMENYK